MADPRSKMGLEVHETVAAPFGLRAAQRTSPDEGGTLDCALVAGVNGQRVIIGELWAMGIGADGTRVRLDAAKISEHLCRQLNGERSDMRCHCGHTNPAGIWNCPECTDPILEAARRLSMAVEEYALEPDLVRLLPAPLAAALRDVIEKARVTW